MTSAVVVIEADLSGCGPAELKYLGEIEISTYTPTAGQYLWNEALCCPVCGFTWGKISYHTSEPVATQWVFVPRECGGSVLSESFLDYILLKDAPSRQEQELVLDEYTRCYDHYAGLSVRRSGLSSSRIPSIDEL